MHSIGPIYIAYALCSAFMIGFGCYVAFVLTKSLRAENKLLNAQSEVISATAKEDNSERVAATLDALGIRLPRRTSNCLSILPDGSIRTKDGGYLRAYTVDYKASLLSDDEVVEDLYDRLSRILSSDKPPGTIIQYRFANHTDPGFAILEHQRAMSSAEDCFMPSRLLHNEEIIFYETLAENSNFRHFMLSVWIYVPVKHGNDNMNNGIMAFWRRLKKDGIGFLLSAIKSGNDGIVRRLAAEEKECFENAERVFRQIESQSPLQMKRMSYKDTWDALYLGHSENAFISPQPPISPVADISDYLCNESIEGNNTWYLLHGNRPVAIISLFNPPDIGRTQSQSGGGIAGMIRGLTNNPNLTGRHTVVAEYISLDKNKAQKHIKGKKRKIERTSTKAGGGKKFTKENERMYVELDRVEGELTNASESLLRLRFFILVYGQPARTKDELDASLKNLELDCEKLITAVKNSMPGADASLEEPASLRAIYHKTIVGEMDNKDTGREIDEVATSLSVLIPAEGAWAGMPNAHTFFSTIGSRIIGVNFFQNKYTTSPLVTVIANSGGGKSVLLARCVNDILASLAHARVRVVDFGESLGPLVEIVGGRHLRFITGEVRTLNIWDYKGLENGEMPDDEQVNLVVEDLLRLSRTNPDSEIGKLRESVLKTCVMDVYRDEVPHNRPDYPKHEPTHSHLLNKLKNYPFQPAIKDHAEQLLILLEEYRNHPWLDATTHKSFNEESRLDVYELDSLDRFPRDIRESLAFRVAAKVIRSIGEKIDGELTPTLLVFDEMKKIKDTYPDIMKAIKKGARQGRKENVVTMLGTQAYEDLEPIRDITANSGCNIIGKQIGNTEQMVKDFGWSEAAAQAVKSIHNVKGSHAQFVIGFGSGTDQQVEMIQVDLSPVGLWTFTSDPVERNARNRVSQLRPDWSTAKIVYVLASIYPRGLTYNNLTSIDESLIPPMPREMMLLQESSAANTDEAIDAEYVGDDIPSKEEMLEAVEDFFSHSETVSSGEETEKRKQLARKLGVDIPGAILAGEDMEVIEAELEAREFQATT